VRDVLGIAVAERRALTMSTAVASRSNACTSRSLVGVRNQKSPGSQSVARVLRVTVDKDHVLVIRSWFGRLPVVEAIVLRTTSRVGTPVVVE